MLDNLSAVNYDEQLEQDLIYQLFLSPQLLNTTNLKEEYFYFKEAKLLFKCLLATYKSDEDLELSVFFANLKATSNVDNELFNICRSWFGGGSGVINVDKACDILVELYQKRQCHKYLTIIHDEIERNDGEYNRDLILSSFEKAQLAFSYKASDESKVQDVADSIFNQILERQKTKESVGISTGFECLDKEIGGLEPSTLTIIAARPRVGKSAFALNLSNHIANYTSGEGQVLFYSFEMSKSQFVDRMYYMNGATKDILKSVNINSAQMELLSRARDKVKASNITVIDKRLDIVEFRASVLAQVTETATKAIFVDYAQIFKKDIEKESTTDHVTRVARELRDLSLETSVPIVVLAQLNREMSRRQDKTPTLEDLKNAGGLEEAANTVLLLHSPYLYGSPESDPKDIDLVIGKNRDGQAGIKLKFHTDLRHMRFYEKQLVET